MLHAIPVLCPIVYQVRASPWRQAIYEAWSGLASSVVVLLSPARQAEAAADVFTKAVHIMSSSPDLLAELADWCKNMGSCTGGVATVRNLALMRPAPNDWTKNSYNLGGATTYVFNEDLTKAVARLRTLAETWCKVSTALDSGLPPQSCGDFAAKMAAAMDILRCVHCPLLRTAAGDDKYVPMCTLRLHLMVRMRRAGIQGCQREDSTVGKLRAMGPDRKNLVALMNGGKNGIGDLRVVAGGCPPEVLAAHLCYLAREACDRFPVAWLEAHEAYIKTVKKVHTNVVGFEGHPHRALGEVAQYCS